MRAGTADQPPAELVVESRQVGAAEGIVGRKQLGAIRTDQPGQAALARGCAAHQQQGDRNLVPLPRQVRMQGAPGGRRVAVEGAQGA